MVMEDAIMSYKNYGEPWRNVFTIIVYGIFIVFSFQQLQYIEDLSSQIVFIGFIGIIFVLAIWYEIIRIYYRKSLFIYNFECNIDTAIEAFQKCRRLDKFNSYRSNEVLFNLFVYKDTFNPEALLQTIEKNEKKVLRRSLDMLLVYNYNMFSYHILTNNKTQVKEYYQKILNLKESRVKGKRVSPLYNWEVIEGEYYLAIGDMKKAFRSLNNVNLSRMNNREKAYVHYHLLRAANALGKTTISKEQYQQLIKLGNQLPIVQLGERIMESSHETT